MNSLTDQLAHWLLASLELDTTLFHVGQYCGTWRAAPSDVMRSGFHLVLNGQCWLHLPDTSEALPLQKGDAVFFIRETTHYLSPSASPDDPALCRVKSGEMLSIDESVPDSVALACGFFHFKSGLSAMLLSSFPDYLIIRGDQTELLAAKTIFDLILTEARQSGETVSPLIVRLTDVLFFYAIRQLATTQKISAGLWAVVQSPEFAKLVEAVINEPEKDWPVEKMADYSHMSRATFFKRFSQMAGQTPNLFLVMVRMKMAAQLLRQGKTISQVAEKVGYQSESAFSKAFKKVIGQQPGAYQKSSYYQNKDNIN